MVARHERTYSTYIVGAAIYARVCTYIWFVILKVSKKTIASSLRIADCMHVPMVFFSYIPKFSKKSFIKSDLYIPLFYKKIFNYTPTRILIYKSLLLEFL